MPDIKRLKVSWLILPIFPFGWYISLNLFANDEIYYTLLTATAFFSSLIILNTLQGPVKREIHLWIIFILFVIGYYVKFYLLCYFKLDESSEYLENYYPLETELLNHTDLIISYFEFVTIVFFVFALLIAVLTNVNNSSTIRSKVYKLTIPHIDIQRTKVTWLLAFSISCFLVLIYMQLTLGLGYVSAADRQVSQLPYHLAGIIMTIYLEAIPLLLLMTVWLANTIRSNYLTNLTIGSYLLFGITAGVLTTSKAPLLKVVISLGVLWLVTDRLSRKRLWLLLSLVPFIGLLNVFLGINRIMRSANPDFGIFEIMGTAGRFFLSGDATLLGYEEPVSTVANYLGLIMRINGADSLMNIINYAPTFSLERIWDLLFVSPNSIATLYAQDVLGRYHETGVAFSPSLLGYFYFVFGDVNLVCLGMIVYTLVWHLLFRTLLRTRLLIEPIVFSMLIVLVGFYTSEGGVESMPQSIVLTIAFAVFGEFIIRSQSMMGASRILQRRVQA